MDKIRANIKKIREEAGLSQKALASMIGKSESATRGYESGKTDIPLSTLLTIASALHVSLYELSNGKQKAESAKSPLTLRIYNMEDRLNVAAILIKNGYTVGQAKRSRTPTGKQLDYLLTITDNPSNADMSR